MVHSSDLFPVRSQFFTHQDMAVSPHLTELGYCANLISTVSHPCGRKHHLLINKNVSWRFHENDSAPRGLLRQKFW